MKIGIVFLNKWEGERFQNEITCDYCGGEGSVILLGDIKLCSVCLHEAIEEINKAVLAAAVNPEKARLIEAQYH